MNVGSTRWWLGWGLGIALVLGGSAFFALRELVRDDFEKAGDRLLLLAELRRDALQSFFDTSVAELVFWSENDYMVDTFVRAVTLWDEFVAMGGDPVGTLRHQYIARNPYPADERYKLVQLENEAEDQLHASMHPFMTRFVLERGYEDFIKVNNYGYIYYSVQKRDDYVTSLIDGDYASSELGKVFRATTEAPLERRVFISDLAPYEAKRGLSAIFIARSMLDHKGEAVGTLALELPSQRIDEIMQFDAGLGKAGELFLVGPDGKPRGHLAAGHNPLDPEDPQVKDILRRAEQASQGMLLDGDKDDRYIWAWESIPVGTAEWTIVGRADKQGIIESQYQRQRGLALLMLAFYGLALSTLWLFSSRDPAEDSLGDPGLADSSDYGLNLENS